MSIESPPQNPHRKRLLIGLGLFFIFCGCLFLIYWLFIGQYNESTDDAYVSGNIVQVMSQISGHVSEILADETDVVSKGSPVVKLDKADAEIALNTAKAQLAAVVRQVNQYFDSVNEAKANILVQKDNLERAKEDFDRRSKLIVNKTISAEEERHAKIALDAAVHALTLAEDQLVRAKSLVGHTSLYQHPQIQQAAVNLRNAYLNWRRTVIYAPETGTVAKRTVQVGQEVNPNTVLMVIVPLEQVWVNANFKESQLKDIRIGQPVTMVADAYGGQVKFKGTVVGLNPGAGSIFDLLPAQNATGNWIKIVQRLPVRIAISKEQLKQHPLRIGLSMTVTVDTHNRGGETLKQILPLHVLYQSQDISSDLAQADQIINEILTANAKNVESITQQKEP